MGAGDGFEPAGDFDLGLFTLDMPVVMAFYLFMAPHRRPNLGTREGN